MERTQWRGRGGKSSGRGRRQAPAISGADIDESWRGGNSLDRAFEDVNSILEVSDRLQRMGGISAHPVPICKWVIPANTFDKSKFLGTGVNSLQLRMPVWKYPETISVDGVKPLTGEDEGRWFADAPPATLSGESALWDLYDYVLGQINRKKELVFLTSSNKADYVDKVIAGRIRVFGATSTLPEKTILRVKPWERAGIRGVCNTAKAKDRIDLIVSVGDSSESVRVLILSAIILKARGFIIGIRTMDTLAATALHTASMFFGEVGVVRYSDKSYWLYGREQTDSAPVWLKNALTGVLTTPAISRNHSFLSTGELTSPAFAETVGVLVDSIDAVGGLPVSNDGWLVRTRWEYYR